jgi:hypothetical protein
MPYAPPRRRTEQDAYNRDMQDRFAATHRVSPYSPQSEAEPAPDPIAQLKELAQLHADGRLTDDEFAAFKAKLLGTPNSAT